MAEVLSLVQRDDFTVDIDSISLLAYTDGFESARDGWKMQSTPDENGHVVETIRLRARGSSIDNLAAKVQGMADKAWQAERYAPIDRYGVWLRHQLSGETGARQAFVYGIRHEQASSVFNQALMAKYQLNDYTLAVERSPYWEGTATTDFASGTALTPLGGTLAYAGVPGDVPARMALIDVRHSVTTCGSVGGMQYTGQYWIGFRSTRYGNPSNFYPYWDTKNGDVSVRVTTGGTVVADSEARSGTYTTTPYSGISGTNMTQVAHMYMKDICGTANIYDQCGKYLAVLRAMNSTTGSYTVQLAYGMEPSEGQFNPRVLINNTTYFDLYPLGMVDIGSQIPYMTGLGTTDYSYFFIDIYAQRNSGTPNLYLDAVYLVPVEGFAYLGASGTAVRAAQLQNTFSASQRPDGAISYSGSDEDLSPDPYFLGNAQMQGGIPPGAGIAVVVGVAGRYSYAAKKCKLSVKAIPRWKELRGAATIWSDVTPPAAWTWTLPFTIQQRGRVFRTYPTFDIRARAAISVSKTYYLNTVSGSDAYSGADALYPMKTWDAIIALGDADRIIIQDGSRVTRASFSSPGSRNLEVIGEGTVYFTAERALGAWSLTAGKTYTFQSSVTAGEYIARVFDERVLDAFGLPTPYTEKASTAEVEALAGSYYWSGGVLYVHTLNGLTPTGQSLRYYDSNAFGAAKDNVFYFENINFRGGVTIANASGSGIAKYYFKDCTGYMIGASGITELVAQNCTFFTAGGDGLNYDDANSVVTKAIEIDCEVYDLGAGSTDQCSTMHGGGAVVRINGKYHHSAGQCIADVGTGQIWMLGSEMYNSTTGIGVHSEQPQMWLDSCWCHDNANYNLENTSGKTIYIRNFLGQLSANNIAGTLTAY